MMEKLITTSVQLKGHSSTASLPEADSQDSSTQESYSMLPNWD